MDLPLVSRQSNSCSPRDNRTQQSQPAQTGIVLRVIPGNEILATTAASHSELGAALSLFRNVWTFLRSGRLQLSNDSSSPRNRWLNLLNIFNLWRNFSAAPSRDYYFAITVNYFCRNLCRSVVGHCLVD